MVQVQHASFQRDSAGRSLLEDAYQKMILCCVTHSFAPERVILGEDMHEHQVHYLKDANPDPSTNNRIAKGSQCTH